MNRNRSSTRLLLAARTPAALWAGGYLMVRITRRPAATGGISTQDLVGVARRYREVDRRRDWVGALDYAAAAWRLETQGNLEGAISLSSGYIRLKPTEAVAYARGAFIYLDRGKLNKAIADFSTAIRLDDGQVSYRHWRALARLAAGEREGYRKDCMETLGRFGSQFEGALDTDASLGDC